jgi:hypothetical protein
MIIDRFLYTSLVIVHVFERHSLYLILLFIHLRMFLPSSMPNHSFAPPILLE